MTKLVTSREAAISQFHVPLRHARHNGVTECPTCGYPIPLDNIAAQFPPLSRRIYELIRDAGIDGITRVSLEHLVYGNAKNGGPETNTIAVSICQTINPMLKSRGLAIRSRRHRFRIVRIEDEK